MFKLTKELAKKILRVIKPGLSDGVGVPEPGKMCIQAAYCYAMGLKHGDEPHLQNECESNEFRDYSVTLNDANWSSPQARAEGMKAMAIAGLGSAALESGAFAKAMALKTINVILPKLLREIGKGKWEDHAKACESAKTLKDAANAASAASAARAASADSYAASADSAANAARAASAASAASYAASADSAANAASAASADSAASYAASADSADSADKYLKLSASLAVETLKELKSPGCEYLHLCDEATVPCSGKGC